MIHVTIMTFHTCNTVLVTILNHVINKQVLIGNIYLPFFQELKSQAAKILGSVDFLGNPLGLFNDVTEGISGLINDGNVGGLLKNVTHGVSNSAAKVPYNTQLTVRDL